MDYDVIIVGAGASGLMAAIAAARIESSVLVLEQKDKPGKKILATGNGKCNYTNLFQSPACYRSDDSTFPMKVLSNFDVARTIRFFEELGIFPKERDGYLYPNSEQAASVVQVLLMECERLRVKIHCNEKVIKITGPDFTVTTIRFEDASMEKPPRKKKVTGDRKNDRNKADTGAGEGKLCTYRGKKLVLSTGGCASPNLGSDGSGYLLAEGFGHTMINPLPALVQLKASDKFCKTLSGVRITARVRIYAGAYPLSEEEGEILFTDYGISGIPVMQISRYAAKALYQGEKVTLRLDFLPRYSTEELKKILMNRISYGKEKSLEQMMVGFFNHKLSYILIREAMLDPELNCCSLKDAQVLSLTRRIKEFAMNVTDTNSFENAQVSAGGIRTTEIYPDTMESRKKKNLYLTGELVDVDGTCGGYNLQWAWSTGYLAGSHAGIE